MDNNFVDHEVRIRHLEGLLERYRSELNGMKDKIDNQFNLIAGTVITSCIGIALHMTKLL